jgi:hypothetical protein
MDIAYGLGKSRMVCTRCSVDASSKLDLGIYSTVGGINFTKSKWIQCAAYLGHHLQPTVEKSSTGWGNIKQRPLFAPPWASAVPIPDLLGD